MKFILLLRLAEILRLTNETEPQLFNNTAINVNDEEPNFEQTQLNVTQVVVFFNSRFTTINFNDFIPTRK